jgi:hypothetical protein
MAGTETIELVKPVKGAPIFQKVTPPLRSWSTGKAAAVVKS